MNNFKKRYHTSSTTNTWTKHQTKSNIVSPTEALNQDAFEVTYTLSKNDDNETKDNGNDNNSDKENTENITPKVYSIFTPKKKPEPKSTNSSDDDDDSSSKYDEMYRNAFRRKKNINLYISGQQVIWEFAFDRTIMAAIKEYVPNRTFDGNIKKWVNPVESLPEAIELYEFMGRTPDDGLVQRSKQIVQARERMTAGGIDASEIITLVVRPTLTMDTNNISATTTRPFGTVNVQFLYDAQIVAAIKMLPPAQRQYDPATKMWPIDLLALPDLIELFLPLGYRPNQQLVALCDNCRNLANVMHEASIINVDEDDDADASSSQVQLGRALESLQELLESHNDNTSTSSPKEEITINRDDCGSSKRPKLTLAQEVWSLKKKEGIEDIDFDSDDGFLDYDTLASRVLSKRAKADGCDTLLATRVLSRRAKADGCDCGRPEILSGGTHLCRYFGSFECNNCGNQWTSAYTWEGERQACRRCEKENYPVKKERLQSGLGEGGDGHHDSRRCSRCKKLGYNCSEYY